jgi:hypothetical protein
VSTGLVWPVWGLIACSFLKTPLISFNSHLILTILLPLGIVVGSVAGFGKFAHNSRSFTLLLIVVYWWSLSLLLTLGHHVLLLILAPPWSNTADGTAYCGKYQVLEFPCHHQWCGLLATYPTHTMFLLTFLSYLWHTDPVHPINAVV